MERSFHPEKEFPLDEKHWFYKKLAKKRWLPLLRPKESNNATIVREFYAATKAAYYPTIDFRGKSPCFNADDIRKYLQSPSVSHCQYQEMESDLDAVNWDQVLQALSIPGTVWRRTAEQAYLDRKNMTDDAKLWLNFMNSNVRPKAHMSSVTRDEALLLYCLMGDFKVDLSLVAEEAIISCAKSDTANLVFPHLISAMCIGEGVPALPGDATFRPVRARSYAASSANAASSSKKQKRVAMEDAEGEEEEASEYSQILQRLTNLEKLTFAIAEKLGVSATAGCPPSTSAGEPSGSGAAQQGEEGDDADAEPDLDS